MNQNAKDKLSESIIFLLEDIDRSEPGSMDRDNAVNDFEKLFAADLAMTEAEDKVKIELAKVKANGKVDLKITAKDVGTFVVDNAIKVFTVGSYLVLGCIALDADMEGKMISQTCLRVLKGPKI